MKRFLQYTVGLFVAALLLVGCETDVEFRGEQMEPQMVVYSVVTAGEPVRVFVSRSSFILDNEDYSVVKGASVELWVNGALVERLKEVDYDEVISDKYGDYEYTETRHHHYYESTHTCTTGDNVEIRVTSTLFEGEAVGKTTIPSEPTLGTLSATIDSVEDGGFTKGTLRCPFTDSEGEKNYYWLRGGICNDSHYMCRWATYSDIAFSGGAADGLLGEIIGSDYEEYIIFDDVLLDGKESYPLSMEWNINQESLNSAGTVFRVECCQVDDNFYKYFRSLELSGDGIFATEPVQVHSNIEGGIGLVASRSATATRELLCHKTEK